MTTVRDIVDGSLKLLGVLFKSESSSADEAADGLTRLNEMLSSWSNEGLMIFARAWENFTLTGNVATYTIGPTGTFVTTRPTAIIAAYIREAQQDYPMQIITDEDYNLKIWDKSLSSNIPEYLCYSPDFPNGTIRIWNVPSIANSIHLLSEKELGTFTNLTDAIELPPGWLEALRYNLAERLAPEYGLGLDPLVLKGAATSKGILKTKARQNRPLTYQGYGVPSSTRGTYDIYAGR